MVVRFYSDGNSFLAENENRMLEQEAVFQLLYGKVLNNRETPLSAHCFFGIVEEAGEPVILFGQLEGFPLTMYSLADTGLSGAAKALAQALTERDFIPREYIAGTPLQDIFFEQWRELYPSAERCLKLASDIMQMDAPADVAVVLGQCRLAREEDLPLVYRYVSGFRADTGDDPRLSDAQRERYAGQVRQGNVYLFETPDGRAVSQVYISWRLIGGACLNGVYTPPEERGKGYAAANVLALSKKLLCEGDRFVTLFVDKQNPISNHVYKKIGYRIVQDSWQYELK